MTEGHPTFEFELPEPPAQTGSRSSRNWRAKWRRKRDAKRKTWAAAITQLRPFRTPPERVRIHAHFRLYARRDPTNLYRDLKPVIDALKAEPAPSDTLAWKQGLFLDRGYFVDDDHVDFGDVSQEIDRDNRGLTLRLEVLDEDWTPPDRTEEET